MHTPLRVSGDRLYDFCEAAYKTYILMPLIRNSPNKRFGLSRYWTQKRSMPNGMNLFSIQNRFMQNGGNLFLTQKRLVQNGSILFSIRKRLMRNEMNLFLTQKGSYKTEGRAMGRKSGGFIYTGTRFGALLPPRRIDRLSDGQKKRTRQLAYQ